MKFLPLLIALFLCARSPGAELPAWAPFVETNFPFFSSVLDARGQGSAFATNNLTPRGLVLNFEGDLHLCFDLDLLRVAAVWRGPGVTPVSMAQGSYANSNWGKKAPEGQGALPRIHGEVWLSNGAYPGIGVGPAGGVDFIDPRPGSETGAEVGLGPLPPHLGQFKAIQVHPDGVTLEYTIDGTDILDRFTASPSPPLHLLRRLEVGPRARSLAFRHGLPAASKSFAPESSPARDGLQQQVLPPSTNRATLDFAYHPPYLAPASTPVATTVPNAVPAAKRWPQILRTSLARASTNEAYRTEHIALPIHNPWRRNVRFSDLAFFFNGRAAAVTFDGDIWLIDGLSGALENVMWRRFASGLHEPLSLAIRADEIFAFDRNGVWRILDTDADGEADRHEMFCNRFTQTAETREFASSMKLAPDGVFIISKPGQTGSTVGRDSGKILRISPDGQTVTELAHGFRQPFLGVNPGTGLITASDQQGHYIPTTPLHVIRSPGFHGFRPTILAREKEAPAVVEPLLWLPHSINASGATQIWLRDRMGPLANSLLHLGYYRSEIFNILWDGGPNAAAVSFTRDLDFAPLNGAVHPLDQSLYVVGFQLWGAAAPSISGLARISYTGAPSGIPRQILPMREGVLIRFSVPLLESTIRPENFSGERWNYRRSHEYGSPHFKLDGSKGQETLFPSSAYLSADRQSVFVGFPGMQPVMQMRFGWSLLGENRMALQQNAYLTPRALEFFNPAHHGFAPFSVDLTPRAPTDAPDATPVTAAEGKRLADLMGCAACHSSDGSSLGKVGPTWKGLAGSTVRFADNTTAPATAEYLRQSIREPAARIVKDFNKSDTGMPSYEGVLTDPQIEALVLYIQSLE